MNNIKFNYCKTSLPETLEIGWVYFVEPEQKFYVVNDAGEPINYTGMSKDEEDVVAATLIALQKEKLGEDEEYVISKALNDLNERINNIDVTDQINAMKNDIEQNSLWKSDNNNIYTSKLDAYANYYAVAIGADASANGGNSVAIGPYARSAYDAVSVGYSAYSTYSSVAIGYDAGAYNDYSVAIGPGAVTNSEYRFVLSHGSYNKPMIAQKTDGSIYIRGIGDWNGSISSPTGKSLQEVLENSEIKASLNDMAYVTAAALTDLNSRLEPLEKQKTINGESILGEGNIDTTISWTII